MRARRLAEGYLRWLGGNLAAFCLRGAFLAAQACGPYSQNLVCYEIYSLLRRLDKGREPISLKKMAQEEA